MTVYLIGATQRFVCLDADDRPTGVPIGSRVLVADTSAEEMYVGDYYASGVLTVADAGEVNDTIEVGGTTYTLVAAEDFDTAGEIPVGATAAETLASIIAAINGTDGVNSAQADVTALDQGDGTILVTAIAVGSGGNSLASVYTAAVASTNAFAAATLLGGHDQWQVLP